MGSYIYDLILQINNNIYDVNNIFIGQQNNYTLPQDNNYIIITELNTGSMGRPNWSYDGENEIETFNTLDYTGIQVDFYGENSELMCRKFRLFLMTQRATQYLFNNAGLSIYNLDDMRNLTMVLDTENYIQRYTQIFRLFNQNVLDLPLENLSGAETILINVDGVSYVN